MPTLWVYKLMYDSGCAPHVQDGLLSLALCKPEIRKRAVEGDWLFGFGARSRRQIRGERLIYIARVTKKLDRPGEYYESPEYRRRWDCVYERRDGMLVSRPGAVFHPDNGDVDRDLGSGPVYPKAVVLLSDDFRYLGTRGTMDYVARWPDLGTYVHELGRGQRRLEPESRIGRMLVELQRDLWKTCDFVGEPTEPSDAPAWDSGCDDGGSPPMPPPRGCSSRSSSERLRRPPRC